MEYRVVLHTTGQYTAYLGQSKKRAQEVQEIVRNVLIQTRSTASAILFEDHRAILTNDVVNGSWVSPTLKERS